MGTTLSLVIPAYNEARRLPPFLAAVRAYLDRRYPDAYEVIVVDDGSRDGLPVALAAVAAEWPRLVVLRHAQNQGKGAAVRTGMLAAQGEWLLFADADGATPIDQEVLLADALRGGADVAIGSRLAQAAHVTRSRRWTRGLAGRGFAWVARRCLGVAPRDTQCGFKMFRRDVGRELFLASRESGYLFDLELLALAGRRGYRCVEVPVNWSEVPGGQLRLWRDSWKMLLGLWRVRRQLAQDADAASRPA